MFDFEYVGGTMKPTLGSNEKFLLLFIVGGVEVPLFQMQKMNLVNQDYGGPASYSTGWSRGGVINKRYLTEAQFFKLFIYRAKLGEPTQYYSFYAEMLESPSPVVTIKPFSLDTTGYAFTSRLRFLRRKEVLDILSARSPSREWLKKQGTLSTALLKQMITVDRSELRQGVRAIRISD